MKQIGAGDIEDLTLGAAILGAGGGGDPALVAPMLHRAIERHGPVPLVEPGELDPSSTLVSVAFIGNSAAIAASLPADGAASRVVQAVQRHVARATEAVLPLQVGGLTSLFALIAAAELGLPCVDADGMRRSSTRLGMTLFALGGLALSPLSVTDAAGNQVLIHATDDTRADHLLRAVIGATGRAAVVGLYPQSAADCAAHAAVASLSYCLELGRLARDRPTPWTGSHPTGPRTVFTGQVTDVVRYGPDGSHGTATLEDIDPGTRLMRIDFQSEYLLATENGRPTVSVPDVIALLDTETGVPVATEAVGRGRRLEVLALPAHERWWQPDGLALAGPRAFGLDVDYVPWAAAHPTTSSTAARALPPLARPGRGHPER